MSKFNKTSMRTAIALSKSSAGRMVLPTISTENAHHRLEDAADNRFTIADLEYFAAFIEHGMTFEEALEELEVEKQLAADLSFQQYLLEMD